MVRSTRSPGPPSALPTSMLNMGGRGAISRVVFASPCQAVQGFFHQPSEQIVVSRSLEVTKLHAQVVTPPSLERWGLRLRGCICLQHSFFRAGKEFLYPWTAHHDAPSAYPFAHFEGVVPATVDTRWTHDGHTVDTTMDTTMDTMKTHIFQRGGHGQQEII